MPFTIPGERVRIAVRDPAPSRGGPIVATVLDVLRPSPHRVVPRCPHFGPATDPQRGCGGCSWQHIAYPEQLRLKSALVARLLTPVVRGRIAVKPTLAATPLDQPWEYRQKVHFIFGNLPARGRRRGALVMGHYARGSQRIVPTRECPVHDDRGNRAAFGFFDAFVQDGVAAAAPAHGRQRPGDAGVLRSLALRVAASSPELMATLVVSDDRDKQLRAATRRGMRHYAAPTSLHLNIHPRDDGFIFGRETRRISGPERLRDTVVDTAFLISPTAFFQTNVRAAEILVRLVLDAVPADAVVVDLYAGAGLFALPLAQRGQTVTAIEENRAAVADGEASARLNRIPAGRCRFVARRVEAALAGVRAADAVVLDPPRDGCTPDVIRDVFGRLRPARVVYISCNPEALARDLTEVTTFPYAIDLIQPVDMFPHTAHVETVVTLTRRS